MAHSPALTVKSPMGEEIPVLNILFGEDGFLQVNIVDEALELTRTIKLHEARRAATTAELKHLLVTQGARAKAAIAAKKRPPRRLDSELQHEENLDTSLGKIAKTLQELHKKQREIVEKMSESEKAEFDDKNIEVSDQTVLDGRVMELKNTEKKFKMATADADPFKNQDMIEMTTFKRPRAFSETTLPPVEGPLLPPAGSFDPVANEEVLEFEDDDFEDDDFEDADDNKEAKDEEEASEVSPKLFL